MRSLPPPCAGLVVEYLHHDRMGAGPARTAVRDASARQVLPAKRSAQAGAHCRQAGTHHQACPPASASTFAGNKYADPRGAHPRHQRATRSRVCRDHDALSSRCSARDADAVPAVRAQLFVALDVLGSAAAFPMAAAGSGRGCAFRLHLPTDRAARCMFLVEVAETLQFKFVPSSDGARPQDTRNTG